MVSNPQPAPAPLPSQAREPPPLSSQAREPPPLPSQTWDLCTSVGLALYWDPPIPCQVAPSHRQWRAGGGRCGKSRMRVFFRQEGRHTAFLTLGPPSFSLSLSSTSLGEPSLIPYDWVAALKSP